MTQKYANKLMEIGYSEESAAEEIEKICNAIKQVMPNATEEQFDIVLRQKVSSMCIAGPRDAMVGVCVGTNDVNDMNEIRRNMAIKAYNENPRKAVQQGLVDVRGKDVIALDTDEYLDAKKTMRNGNYGKPLPVRKQRRAWFVIDGELRSVYGDFECEIGNEYEIVGKVSKTGNISVNPPPQPKVIRTLGSIEFGKENQDELWNFFNENLAGLDIAVDLEDVPSCKKSSWIVTMGDVSKISENGNGGITMYINDSGLSKDIACFSDGSSVRDFMSEACVGTKVMILARVGKKVYNNEEFTNLSVVGCVSDPESGDIVDVMSKLNDIL